MDFTNHPLINVLWSFFIIFIWVAWFWILISIVIDVFRRHDIGGGMKAVWLIVLIFVPFLGVLVYLVTQSSGMAERQRDDAKRQYRQLAAQVGDADPATQIAQAKQLLDQGAIDEGEFQRLKEKALA